MSNVANSNFRALLDAAPDGAQPRSFARRRVLVPLAVVALLLTGWSALAPISVSVRTRFATEKVFWNMRSSSLVSAWPRCESAKVRTSAPSRNAVRNGSASRGSGSSSRRSVGQLLRSL